MTATAIARYSAPRLALFNHKGGVGKTTLTIDLAAALARLGKRVLLVDSDPQCNLTSHLIEEEVVDELLDNSDNADGQTLWSAIKPVVEATGSARAIPPIERRENLFVLPGDIRLTEFEAELNDSWAQCYERKAKGFRGSTALSLLVNEIAGQIHADFVFYDTGPNIGALNRVVLLDCDFFAVPVACDLFSVRALQTLGRTLSTWIQQWATITDLAPAGTYLLPGTPSFIGYLAQRFKMYGQRIARDYSTFLSQIDRHIQSDVISVLREIDPKLANVTASQFMLGQVQEFGAVVAKSQRDGVPIAEKRRDAKTTFDELAAKVVERTTPHVAQG